MRGTLILAFLAIVVIFSPGLLAQETAQADEPQAQPIEIPYSLPSVGVSTGLGLFALFVTQAAKQAFDEKWHRYIPLALIVILPAVGLGLAAATGNTTGQGLVQGALEGVVAAWAAVYGYQAYKKSIRGQ